MVKIIDFKTVKPEEGKDFTMLIVQGGIEQIISMKTGKIYLTMRKANVSTTFDEITCKSLIGTELPGMVRKVVCEPYEYQIPDSDEVVTLNYRWQYVDDDLINANNQTIAEHLVC